MAWRRPQGARDLRTVLFTDIVGSTERAATLGDRAWGDLLARHHAQVRAALRASGGREMDTAGDGFFATFARPTDALACAARIVRGMAPLDLQVRVGLHAGEVETRDGKAAGITVHTAARLMAAAGPDEVLASATVRELAAGAGWTFADRGSLTLKGLAEPVHAYALDLAAAPTGAVPGPVGAGAAFRAAGSRWPLLGAGGVVALVVLLGAVAFAGGGARPTPTPSSVAAGGSPLVSALRTSKPAPTQDQTASPSASTEGSLLPETSSEDGYPLAPGTYLAQDLPPTPSLTVTDPGWRVDAYFHGDLQMSRETSPSDTMTLRWLESLATDPCAQQPEAAIDSQPDKQFLAWVRANRALQVSAGTPRRFGELTTTEIDVSVIAKYACQYTTPVSVSVTGYHNGGRVDTFVLAASVIGFEPGLVFNAGVRTRVEVAARDGQLVLIVLAAPSAAEFASFEPLAEAILGTITFSP